MARDSETAWADRWRETVTASDRDRSFGPRWPVAAVLFTLPIIIPAVAGAFAPETSAVRAVFGLALVAAYCACYAGFPWVLFRDRPLWTKLAFCVAMLGLGWLATFLVYGGTVYVLLYAMAVIALSLPAGWAMVLDLSSLAVLFLLAHLHIAIGGDYSDVGTLTGITSALFFMGRLLRTVRVLRAAQDEIATLAVNAERERLARDLHDILGHSLTTITVKAGLARRVLESSADTERAIQEIREVEGLSRGALSDVRATVSEYREVSLSAELVGARAALRAAEIDGDLPHAVDNVRLDLQQTFGYVLREAITNVVRHSGAKHVKVRLGETWLEIEDDGVGAPEGAKGNGLRGIAERLEQVGGTLRTDRGAHGGFVVRAQVRPALEAVS